MRLTALFLLLLGVAACSALRAAFRSRSSIDPLRFFKRDRPVIKPFSPKQRKPMQPPMMQQPTPPPTSTLPPLPPPPPPPPMPQPVPREELRAEEFKRRLHPEIDHYDMDGSSILRSKYEEIQQPISQPSNFKCPKKYGTWPVLDNCKNFIQCHGGDAREIACPSDLHYNPASRECDFPAMAYCPFRCPDPNGEFPLYGDCTGYIVCTEGIPELRVCPEGLHWDRVSKQCDVPDVAGCPLKCPSDNGTYPFIEDCGSYIFCEHGRPHLKRCPIGLFFSMSSLTCQPHMSGLCPFDFQCQSRTGRFPVLGNCAMFLECNKDGLGNAPAGTVAVRTCPEGLLYNYVTEQCEIANTSFCVNTCPAEDGIFEIAGLCNYYKICTNNVSRLYMCPNNLHFDPVEKHCEKPASAGCIPKCTQSNGVNGVPGKCNQYVECIEGVPELKHCPANLHFNQLLKVCDTPENSKCEFTCPKKNGFFPIPGKCEDYIECKDNRAIFQHCPTKLHFNNRIKMCDFPENAKCANTCPQPDGIFAVEGDCSAFVKCTRNVPTIGTCGEGHSFNAVTAQCDMADNVACDPQCPAVNGRFPMPGKQDDSFLECVGNRSTVKTCSSGLRLNPSTETCDW